MLTPLKVANIVPAPTDIKLNLPGIRPIHLSIVSIISEDVKSLGFDLTGIRVQVVKEFEKSTWSGAYSVRDRLIELKAQSLSVIRELTIRSFATKWHPVDTWLHTTHHEFGHALHRKLNSNAYRKYGQWQPKSELRAKRKIPGKPLFSSPNAEKIAGQVSTYARTNPREFVAETFTGLMAHRPYTDEVLQMYLELRGPVAPVWQSRFDSALLRIARSGR